MLKALKGLRPAGRLFARWRVTFEGEQGRDDGGILVATYAKVHRHLYGCTATRHLFEVDPDAERGIADSETCVLPLADAKWAATFAKGVSLEPPDAAAVPPPAAAAGDSGAGAVAPAARRKRQRWTRRCRWRRRCRSAAGCSPKCCSTATGTASTTASDFVLEYLVTDNMTSLSIARRRPRRPRAVPPRPRAAVPRAPRPRRARVARHLRLRRAARVRPRRLRVLGRGRAAHRREQGEPRHRR